MKNRNIKEYDKLNGYSYLTEHKLKNERKVNLVKGIEAGAYGFSQKSMLAFLRFKCDRSEIGYDRFRLDSGDLYYLQSVQLYQARLKNPELELTADQNLVADVVEFNSDLVSPASWKTACEIVAEHPEVMISRIDKISNAYDVAALDPTALDNLNTCFVDVCRSRVAREKTVYEKLTKNETIF
jgi:hypothetical protein